MGSLDTRNTTTKDGFKKLKGTIKQLNKTAHSEDFEMKKEEDEVAKLKATILNFVCDCEYYSWGAWGSCSKTCGNGTKERSRDVKWYPRNNGMECIESDQEQEQTCNRFSEIKIELASCEQNFANISQKLANLTQSLDNATGEIKRLNEKLCLNVLCKNRGTCQEGECICTDGYSGSTCEEKGRLYRKP